MDLDLRDCNDLLPALSAYLAMGPGGRIRNAAHARFKESDRISKTVEMIVLERDEAVTNQQQGVKKND